MHEERIRDLLRKQYAVRAERIELLSHSSKMVHKVETANGETYIFDIYADKERNGRDADDDSGKYAAPEAIASEARILTTLRERCPELRAPYPIRTVDGALVTAIALPESEELCLLRRYIDGVELKKGSAEYAAQVYQAGAAAATFHLCSETHLRSEYGSRPAHRQPYVLSLVPRLERGIGAGTITPRQFGIIRDALALIRRRMDELDRQPRASGIVHTDIRDANLLFDGTNVIPIDFGRCVYGYLMYDLGEMCAHMGGDDESILVGLVEGYHAVRALSPDDIVAIEAFKMLFILSVVAEFAPQADNAYVIETVRRLTERDLVRLLAGEPIIPGIRGAIPSSR